MVYYNVRWKDEFIAIVIKMYCFMIVLIKYMIDGLNGKSTIEGHFIPKPLDKKHIKSGTILLFFSFFRPFQFKSSILVVLRLRLYGLCVAASLPTHVSAIFVQLKTPT